MRICYFADGRYIHALRWMKFFAQHGHEMHLISFAPMSTQNLADMEGIGVKCHGTIEGFHTKRFWKTFNNVRRIKRILSQEKIDILHCHFLGSNAWYSALSGFQPFIITVMGGDVTGQSWKPDSNWQESVLTPYALKKAKAVTLWSNKLVQIVKPYLQKDTPLHVIHGGIDLKTFNPMPTGNDLRKKLDIPPDCKILFSPRLMRKLYNIDNIVSAIIDILELHPKTVCLIPVPKTALDIEYYDKVKQIKQSLPDESRPKVVFLEQISHNDIADYFKLADVTISIPSTDGTPMTVLESMACGTPTVIGNLSDYDREYFEHEKTTLMVDVNDPKSIAKAVLRFLEDKELTDKIVNEARRRVMGTGSYETQMLKMDALYQSLVKNE